MASSSVCAFLMSSCDLSSWVLGGSHTKRYSIVTCLVSMVINRALWLNARLEKLDAVESFLLGCVCRIFVDMVVEL